MKKMKLALMAIGAACSFSALAMDDTPENREREAVRYEKVADTKEMMNSMFDAMSQSMGGSGNPLMPVILQFVREEVMTEADMVKKNHDAYVKNFTANELKALADFYGSTEGQAVLKKMPKMAGDLMNTMMPEMMERMKAKAPLLKERVKAYLDAHPEVREQMKQAKK